MGELKELLTQRHVTYEVQINMYGEEVLFLPDEGLSICYEGDDSYMIADMNNNFHWWSLKDFWG